MSTGTGGGTGTGGAPVVVVGAGPVGCAVALLLAARGVETVVLERHREPYPLPRAVHVDDEVYAILADLGVAEAFAAVSRPMPGMRLVDARHRTLAEFRRDAVTGPLGWPQASMFDQPDLERILLQRLAREPLTSLHREHLVTRVAPHADGAVVHHVDAAGREHRTPASAVLGCDGANSTTRGAVGAQWSTCTSASAGWSSTCGCPTGCRAGAACTRSAIPAGPPPSCTSRAPGTAGSSGSDRTRTKRR